MVGSLIRAKSLVYCFLVKWILFLVFSVGIKATSNKRRPYVPEWYNRPDKKQS